MYLNFISNFQEMMMNQPENQVTAKRNKDDVSVVGEEQLEIERIVAVTEAEVLGVAIRSDELDILLEFGYKKSDKSNVAIIDTRKKLPIKMAKQLYEQLKEYFDSEDDVED